MSSLRRIAIAGVGLLGTVAALTACAGDGQQGIPTETDGPAKRVDMGPTEPSVPAEPGRSAAGDAGQEAIREAQRAANPRRPAGGAAEGAGEDPPA